MPQYPRTKRSTCREFTAQVQQLLAAHPWAQLSPTELHELTQELHYHLLDLLAELTDHAHSPAQPTETQPKISETDDEEEPIDQTSTVTPPSIPTLANGSNPTATDVSGATVEELLPAGSHTTKQPTANHAHDADEPRRRGRRGRRGRHRPVNAATDQQRSTPSAAEGSK